MNQQPTIVERAIQSWRNQGVKLLPPADEDAILATMKKIGRPISRDVVELCRRVGGFEDMEMDSYMWSFWSLNRIFSEHTTLKYERPDILFADFLICSHCYSFHYENSEVSTVQIDFFSGDPIPIAASVEEFLSLYLSDPKELLLLCPDGR